MVKDENIVVQNSVPARDSDIKSLIDYPGFNDESGWSDADTLMASSVGSLSEDLIPPGIDILAIEDVKAEKHLLDITPELILSSLCITDPATAIVSIPQPSPNTCSWILKHPKYTQWKATRNSLLWIEAPSGYGKSVLTKFLVNEHGNTSACYFFCDSNTKDRNNRRAVLRNLIYHMMLKHPELFSNAKTAYHKLGRLFPESLSSLIKIFKACSQDPRLGELVIIIDGLDECSDFQDLAFLDWITSTLQPATPNSLRFIVTSRPSSAVLRVSSSAVIRLFLDTEACTEIGHDVHRFIDTTVNELPNAQKWTSQARTEFVDKLGKRSKNTFLWAKLFLRELQNTKELSLDSAKALLDGTPNGVPGMYQRIFDKVPEGDHENTKFLLQMIVAAHHPLSIQELNWLHAVHTSGGKGEHADKVLTPDFQTYFRDLCGSLVTVIDGKVLLQHKSAKDFVTASSGHDWYWFTAAEAKMKILQCCIWRLRSATTFVQNMEPRERSQLDNATFSHSSSNARDKFLVYALSRWFNHFNEVQPFANSDLVQQVKSLYEEQDTFQIWRVYYWSWYARDTVEKLKQTILKLLRPVDQGKVHVEVPEFHSESSASIVRMASHLGHVRVFRALLDANPSLFHAKFDDGWTSLSTAIHRNQVEMVRLILEQNVDPNTICQGRTPLNYAAAHSSSVISMALLEHGAAVDGTSVNQMAALHRAAILGHVEVVKTLLEADANPNLVDVTGKTALHYACSKGHVEIIKILLDHKANPELYDIEERTPFVLAAEQGEVDVVKLLLETTTLEIFSDCHKLILHAAMRSGRPALIQMLLDSAAFNIQAKDRDGFSAFAYALPGCGVSTLKWFFEHGADLDECDSKGRTILHRVAAADLVESAKYLLEHGVDVHKTTTDGQTALHCAVAGTGHEPMFQLFLAQGADLEAKDVSGHTPFHIAVVNWRSQTTLNILNSLTANVDTRDHDGETPLHAAIRAQNAGLVQWLLFGGDARHDILSKDGYYLDELNRMSFIHKLDSITLNNQTLLSYPIWYLPVQDDNCFQKFKGTVSEAAIAKNRQIIEWLKLKGTMGNAIPRRMLISFLPPIVDPTGDTQKVMKEVSGIPGGPTISLNEKSTGSSGVACPSVLPQNTKERLREIQSTIDPADVSRIEEGAKQTSEEDPNGDHSPSIVPTFNIPRRQKGTSQIRNSSSSSTVNIDNNSKEEHHSGFDYDREAMQGVSEKEKHIQDITDTIQLDRPEESITPLSNKYECGPINLTLDDPLFSDSFQESAEKGKTSATDTPHHHSPNFTESSSFSNMSIWKRADSSEKDSSSPPQHTPAGSDKSFLSDDEFDSESSYITDSSDELKGDIVPTLDHLGLTVDPELALSLEATRRAISEILFSLSATAGQTSSSTTGSTSSQPTSLGSSSDQGNSEQASDNRKAPLGNGGNEDSGMGNDGSGIHGKDNEGREEYDENMQDPRIDETDHCACCPNSRSKPGTESKQTRPLAVETKSLLKFACPYFKHNPNHHFKTRACRAPGWSIISRVK